MRGPVAIGIALSLAAAGVVGIVVARSGAKRPEPAPRSGPDPSVTADVEDNMSGLVAGTVRLPDGTPAADASVYLDAYFMPLGQYDDKMGIELRSTFLDEDGTPIDVPSDPLPKHEPFATKTDARGRFAFPASEELRELLDDRIKVWATKEELVAPKVLVRWKGRRVRTPDLVLGPAIHPKIRLLTSDGAPVVDAHVELSFSVADEFGNSEVEWLYSVGSRTDADGLADLPAVPDRPDWRTWLRVNPNDMPRDDGRTPSPDRLRRGDPVEIRISRGFTVRGRVAPSEDDRGARVVISARQPSDPDPNFGHSTTAAEGGSFELRGVPTRDATLRIVRNASLPAATSKVPFLPMSTTPSALLTRQVEGREGEVVDLGLIRLEPTLTISGTVLDPSGRPASNGHVVLDGIGMGHSIARDGTFSIPGVERGRHTLTATIYEGGSSSYPSGDLEVTLQGIEAGARDVVLRVTGGGNLVVRFHPVGKPDEALRVASSSLCWGHCGGGGDEKATEIRMALKPGRRDDLRVEAEGYRPKMLGPVEILADRKTVVDVELEPLE